MSALARLFRRAGGPGFAPFGLPFDLPQSSGGDKMSQPLQVLLLRVETRLSWWRCYAELLLLALAVSLAALVVMAFHLTAGSCR